MKSALAFLVVALACTACQVQRINLNRAALLGVDRAAMSSGADLVVRYKGNNTSNGAWVRNIAADSVLADTHCLANEVVRLRVNAMKPGTYEVGFSGCWSDHSVLLMVHE